MNIQVRLWDKNKHCEVKPDDTDMRKPLLVPCGAYWLIKSIEVAGEDLSIEMNTCLKDHYGVCIFENDLIHYSDNCVGVVVYKDGIFYCNDMILSSFLRTFKDNAYVCGHI